MNEGYLKEKVILFLYVIYKYSNRANKHTLERYLYLYFFSLNFFLSEDNESIDNIVFSKYSGNIVGLDEVYSDLEIAELIEIDNNDIVVFDTLYKTVSTMLENTSGQFYYEYKGIQPFVNLLKSYNDDYIFTIFFSEPTQKSIEDRNIDNIYLNSSKLVKLLNEFRSKLKNKEIDDYDILTHWMNFVLKEYYVSRSNDNGWFYEFDWWYIIVWCRI